MSNRGGFVVLVCYQCEKQQKRLNFQFGKCEFVTPRPKHCDGGLNTSCE